MHPRLEVVANERSFRDKAARRFRDILFVAVDNNDFVDAARGCGYVDREVHPSTGAFYSRSEVKRPQFQIIHENSAIYIQTLPSARIQEHFMTVRPS